MEELKCYHINVKLPKSLYDVVKQNPSAIVRNSIRLYARTQRLQQQTEQAEQQENKRVVLYED